MTIKKQRIKLLLKLFKNIPIDCWRTGMTGYSVSIGKNKFRFRYDEISAAMIGCDVEKGEIFISVSLRRDDYANDFLVSVKNLKTLGIFSAEQGLYDQCSYIQKYVKQKLDRILKQIDKNPYYDTEKDYKEVPISDTLTKILEELH